MDHAICPLGHQWVKDINFSYTMMNIGHILYIDVIIQICS